MMPEAPIKSFLPIDLLYIGLFLTSHLAEFALSLRLELRTLALAMGKTEYAEYLLQLLPQEGRP